MGVGFLKPRTLTSAVVGGCGGGGDDGGITPKASPPGKRSNIEHLPVGRAGASRSRYYNRYKIQLQQYNDQYTSTQALRIRPYNYNNAAEDMEIMGRTKNVQTVRLSNV